MADDTIFVVGFGDPANKKPGIAWRRNRVPEQTGVSA